MKKHETLKTLAVLALAAVFFHLLGGGRWLAWLAAAFLGLGLSESRYADAVAGRWLRFSEALGHFNTRIILFLIYWLVLTPFALLWRLLNPALADRFRRDPGATLFEDADGGSADKAAFEKPW